MPWSSEFLAEHYIQVADAMTRQETELDQRKRQLHRALRAARFWKRGARGIWHDREKVYEQRDQYQREVAWQAERVGKAEAECERLRRRIRELEGTGE